MTMPIKFIASTVVAACLIGSAGFAIAQTAVPTPAAPAVTAPVDGHQMHQRGDMRAMHEQMIDKLFARLDPQKTGVITIDAYLKQVDARFDKIDTKKQGFIDHDELLAHVGTAKAQMADWIMKRLDTKGDGKITKDEFEKPARKRFAIVDLNDDGKITREEAELAGPMLRLLAPHEMRGDHARGNGEWKPHHKMNDQQ